MNLREMSVDEYTTPCPTSVERSVTVGQILDIMSSESYRHIPVLSEGKPVGIISDRDLGFLNGLSTAESLTAGDIMTPAPYTVKSGTPLEQVVLNMSAEKIGSALIVDNSNCIVGIFTATDAMNALVEVLRGDLDN